MQRRRVLELMLTSPAWWWGAARAVETGVVPPAALPVSPESAAPALSGTVLLLVPDMPFDPLYPALVEYLKQNAGREVVGPLHTAATVLGKVGSDPGAWRQASSFIRASFWFMSARQGLMAQDLDKALQGLRVTRAVLEQGRLTARAPLLASIELLSGGILLQKGALAAAEEAFRTACVIDPSDQSEQLPAGAARQAYLSARRWVQEAERRPVRINVNTEGPGEVTLYINGSRVMGRGPLWLIELPPGRHLIGATRDGTRPDAKTIVLPPAGATGAEPASALASGVPSGTSSASGSGGNKAPGPPAGVPAGATQRANILSAGDGRVPDVFLRLEPGNGGQATLRPFSLAEASGVMDACQKLIAKFNAAQLMLAVGARLPDNSEDRLGPKVGIQNGVRVNPGPDAGDEPPPVPPADVELFTLSAAGAVTWIGQSCLRL